MTPYGNWKYFLIILLILLPMMWTVRRRSIGWEWIVFATVVMLIVQYRTVMQITTHAHWPELLAVGVFALFQWGLVKLALGRRIPSGALLIIPLGLIPLLVAKFLPLLAPQSKFGFTGISYVTFRALDVLWAVTDGLLLEVGLMDLLVFLFFFPTISSGPVDRFRRFKAEWRQPRDKAKFWADFDSGLHPVMIGLLYKFVLDTILERHIHPPAQAMTGAFGTICQAYVYSAHLFFDFAGYSSFAVGVSRWFGISTPANFNFPWAAQNIRDFWNRWHMSLSFWFRDHVYSRFLIAAIKRKWFKKRETAGNLAYFVSFGLMGLWHGITWFYVLYGIYHATLFVIFDAFTRWKKRRPQTFAAPVWKWSAHLLTVHAVIFGFWLFSGNAGKTAEKTDKVEYDLDIDPMVLKK